MKLKRFLAAITAVAMSFSIVASLNVMAEDAAPAEGTVIFSEDFEGYTADTKPVVENGIIDTDLLVKDGIGVDGSKAVLIDTHFGSGDAGIRNSLFLELDSLVQEGKTYKLTASVARATGLSDRMIQEWNGLCTQFIYPAWIYKMPNPDKPEEIIDVDPETGKANNVVPEAGYATLTKYDNTNQPDSVRTDLYKMNELTPNAPYLPADSSFTEVSIVAKIPAKDEGREAEPYKFEILNIAGAAGCAAYIDNLKIEEIPEVVYNPECKITFAIPASNVVYGTATPNTFVYCKIGDNEEKECAVDANGDWLCYFDETKDMGYNVEITAYCVQQGYQSEIATANTGAKPAAKVKKPKVNKVKAKAKKITGKTSYKKAKVEIKYNKKKIGTTKTTAKKTFSFKVPKKVKLAKGKKVQVRVQYKKKWSAYTTIKVK